MNDNKNKFKKFFFSVKLKNAMLVISGLVAVVYLILLMFLNYSEKAPEILSDICLILKDFCVVVFSIVTTSVLTTWFIEVDSRNSIYKDIICKDFLSSQDFYLALPEEHKTEMLENLERNIYYDNNPFKESMHKSIIEKLKASQNDYYYSDYIYTVTCGIKDGIITKHIRRTFQLRSYNDTCSIERLHLIRTVYSSKDGVEGLKFKGLRINEEDVDLKDNTKIDHITNPKIDEQKKSCGYDKDEQYIYIEPIMLSSDKDVTIDMEYITRVPVCDNSFTCRVKRPCKKFELNFKLDSKISSNYTLSSAAFGFVDDAIKSVHSASRDSVKVNFDNWIFESDGAVVVISDR